MKILVLRFSAMGDVAMTVPVIKALTEQNPDVQIVFVSRNFFKPFFQDIPQVKFLGIDLKNNYKGIVGLFRLFIKFNKLKPNAIADLHDVLRTKILRIFFSVFGYKIVKINKGRKEKKALTRSKNKIFKSLKTTHERYADVFRKLGYKVDLNLVQPIEKPKVSKKTDMFLRTFNKNKLLGIAPFAAHEGKQYPLEKTKEIIQTILKKNKNVSILLFGGGKKEEDLLDKLEKIDSERIVNIAGKFLFNEELQIISHLDKMLSMDSGNAHLAALFGIPVYTIWGATHPYAGFMPFKQPVENQFIPDLKKFPQLPTSVYGNKTFLGFEQIWDTISTKTIVENLLKI